MSGAHVHVPVGERQPPAWGRLLWGLFLVGAGTAWLLDASGVVDVTLTRLIAVALIALGIVVPFVPDREHGGVVALGVVLVVLALMTVVAGPAVHPRMLQGGAGDLTFAPASVEQMRPLYEHGAGDVTVDLQRVAFPAGTTRARVELGAGQVRVLVPDDVTVQVDAEASIGDVVVDSQERSGVAPSFTGVLAGTSTERVLDLDVSVGFGRVEVAR